MSLRRHSVTINGHRTSVAIEDEFWMEVTRIAQQRGISTARLIAEVDRMRTAATPPANLSSALRLYVLNDLKR
ncbi:MAG: putative DNA-binding ribbon-helix-helix protein [Alphaproteobacteria bacterium]|jgi:predicted DNA-binding ribbon-helix-helix protein